MEKCLELVMMDNDIIEKDSSLICCYAEDTTLLYINDNIRGYEGNLIGKKFVDLVHEEDRERILKKLEDIKKTKTTGSYVHSLTAKNGDIYWYLWTIKGEYSEREDFIKFNAVGHNLTKLRKTVQSLSKEINWGDDALASTKLEYIMLIEKLNLEILEKQRTAHQLEEQLQFMQVLLDTIPNPIFVKDKQGVYIKCNKAFTDFLGMKKEELLGKTVYDVYSADNADLLKEKDEELIFNKQVQTFEGKLMAPTGKEKDFIFSKAVFQDINGKEQGLIAVLVDISKRKESEEALKEAGRYLNEILDNLPLAIATYDEKYYVSYTNKRALDILGYQIDEIKGLKDQEVARLLYDGQDKHYLAELDKDNRILKNQIVNIRKKNGSIIKCIYDYYKLDTGGFLCLFEESNRVQALENLQFQTEMILNAVSNQIIMLNLNNCILSCNNAFIQTIEMEKNEIIGRDIYDIVKYLKCKSSANLKYVLEWQEQQTYECSFITPSGNKKELLVHSAPLNSLYGEIIGGIIVSADITFMKNETERLKQQEKLILLGQMAAGLVHEVKNPLTVILGFSHLIKMKTDEDVVKEYADYIEREVLGLNKVVSDFLTFAKPRPPVLSHFSLNSIVQSLKQILEPHLFIKKIKLSITLAAEEKSVRIDENQIKQVVLNIVKNAEEILKGNFRPRIEISTGYNAVMNEMFIRIFNNGRAMSTEEIKSAGTPFFTTKEKGTGLGLSICYQIIKEHRGRIEIEAQEGEGTTFILFFPVYEEQSYR